MRNKIFTRIIITTLLCAFLTFSVGKVTRVSAVGTTAAIAGTAFILTGAVYLSYIALTQGEMVLPAAEEMHDWLGSIGRKVSQYPSGAAAYQDIYQGLLKDPTANVIDGVWTWTQDRIKSFINDFSDTRIISDITGYDVDVDTESAITNRFNYSFTPFVYENVIRFDQYTYIPFDSAVHGQPIIYSYPLDGQLYSGITYVNDPNIVLRNVLKSNGVYGIQQLTVNGIYTDLGTIRLGVTVNDRYYAPVTYGDRNCYSNIVSVNYSPAFTFPVLTQADTYVEATGEIIQAEELAPTRRLVPSWNDPDNENRPIVPWVPIPDIPTGIPTPPGYTGPPQWGFPLAELLDLLEELAEGLIKIDAIARLINEFAGQHGDNYYLEYNDGDTNYYTYYQPTVFDNDTEYVTYNINVSEQEDVIPVDLNTISLYTQNRYLEQIKNSAVAGSTMLRDLAVFWHDVDPEVTYIVFGCCILVLIGAFTGKLGHS